jgi:hypothetical protein
VQDKHTDLINVLIDDHCSYYFIPKQKKALFHLPGSKIAPKRARPKRNQENVE